MRRFSLLQWCYWWTVGAIAIGVCAWLNRDPIATLNVSAFVLIGIALGQWRGWWGMAACAGWVVADGLAVAYSMARSMQVNVSPPMDFERSFVRTLGAYVIVIGVPVVAAAALAGWVHRRFVRPTAIAES